MQKTEKGSMPDIGQFLEYLLRRLKIVVGIGGFCTLLAILYVFLIATPMYESTVQMYVVSSKDSVVNLSDLQIGSYLTSDYQLVFQTWEVNEQVISRLNLPYTVTQLRDMVKLTNPSNTRALFLTVTSEDPGEAALIANEMAAVGIEYIEMTMLTDKPTILSEALEPIKPVRPKKLLIVGLTLVLSVLCVIWTLFLMYLKNDCIITEMDVHRCTEIPLLAVIPFNEKKITSKRR